MGKNRINTKDAARITTMFGSRTNYEMFCIYWAYLCTKLNPNTVNKIDIGGAQNGKKRNWKSYMSYWIRRSEGVTLRPQQHCGGLYFR